MTSHPIHQLSSRIVDELSAHYPELASYHGVPGHDHEWADLSPDGASGARATLDRLAAEVAAVPPPSSRGDRLAAAVAAAELAQQIDRYERGAHLRDLNSVDSPLQGFREAFDWVTRTGEEAWESVAIRLETLPRAVAGYVAALDLGRRSGDVVARRQVEEAIRQARVVASPASPFVSLPTEYGDGPLRRRLDDAAATGRAALAQLADYLEDSYLADASPKDGVGRARYGEDARRFLGTDVDLDETYAWGWEEIERLRRRMIDVARRVVPGGDLDEALVELKTNPGRASADHRSFVAFVQGRLARALDELQGRHFDVPPEIRLLEVRIAPPGGALGAQYVAPSEDLTRPGAVWWAFDGDGPVPLYDAVTTAHHEGVPGHHLQSGIQVTLAGRLSRLHRLWVWKSGTGEGWALYAERLMDELGFLDTADYELGFLAAQMLRACRVVIDIGAHCGLPIPAGQPFRPGEEWRFEAGTEMLRSHATLDGGYAESEMTRYLGWPGQAIAYKVGEREILALRDTEQRRLGASFDPKVFHAKLLEAGAVGIDVLRAAVADG